MSALGRVLFVSGLAVALTAATVGSAFFGVTTWLTLGPLVAGLAAAALGVVAAWRSSTGAGRGFGAGRARLALEIVAAVGLAVLANAASLHAPAVFDVTASKRNTLTEASAKVAKAVDAPVVVETTLRPDDRASVELEELVGRYARENPLITLERVSADKDPEAARAFGDEKVLVVRGDVRHRVRFAAGAPDQEEQLTNAIRAVSTGKRVRVYVVAGHGEPSMADDGAAGIRRFGQALVDEGLEVVPLPLAAVGRVPDDAGAVLVVAPAQIPDAERALLQKYVDGGGRLMALLEPGQESLASLLGAVGIQVDDDVIVDSSSFAGLLGPETATGTAYATHPVTTKLAGALTHFSRARSLSENPGTPATTTALVQTGADAFGARHLEAGPGFHDGDIKGPLTVVMAASEDKARLVVAGDASFVSNQGLGLGSNRDLAVNAVLWLVEREGNIAVRPRGRGGDLLLLTPTARERIAFLLLYGMPVILLCAGLSIGAVRRRR